MKLTKFELFDELLKQVTKKTKFKKSLKIEKIEQITFMTDIKLESRTWRRNHPKFHSRKIERNTPQQICITNDR